MPDNLSLGATTSTTLDIDISGGGTSVTLPQATTTTAGLLSADDKAKMIRQGGNAFGTTMEIGTNDSNNLNFKTGGNLKAWFDPAAAHLWVVSLANQNTENNSIVKLDNAGTRITRNVGDGNAALTVDQKHTSSGGNILTFQYQTSTVAQVNKDGQFAGIGIRNFSNGANSNIDLNTTGVVISRNVADTNIPLIVNSNAGMGAIQNWHQANVPVAFMNNDGVLYGKGLSNGATPNNSFIETKSTGTVISRNVADTNVALKINQQNAGSTGSTLILQKAGSDQMSMSSAGVLKVNNLAGTGTRMVVADSSGNLSSANQVTSGSYTPTITGPDSYTLHGFRYSRIGDIVHVSGAVEVTSGSVGALSFNLGLPSSMSSTFTDMFDITGVVSGLQVLGDCCVFADIINNEADVKFTTTQMLSTVFLQFDYIIQ